MQTRTPLEFPSQEGNRRGVLISTSSKSEIVVLTSRYIIITIFPDGTVVDVAVSKALEKSLKGKRCVITGVGSTRPLERRPDIWNQVSNILRPLIPSTVAPLKMI